MLKLNLCKNVSELLKRELKNRKLTNHQKWRALLHAILCRYYYFIDIKTLSTMSLVLTNLYFLSLNLFFI